MVRPEKAAAVEEIREKITSADAAVLTDYRGLSVSDLAELRAALRAAGTRYKVYKNTLARRACETPELQGLLDLLVGPTAWAFVDGDVATAAKALKEFAKGNEHLVVKGGLLDGALIGPEQVDVLADLPPREELLAIMAGAFQGPMAKAAGLFSAVQRKTAYAVKALIDARVEAGEEPPPSDDDASDDTAPEAPAASDDAPADEAAANEPEAAEASDDAPAEETPAEPDAPEASDDAPAAEEGTESADEGSDPPAEGEPEAEES